MIQASVIDKVKQLDIRDIIGKHVSISKNTACCPIHNEKTPSLHIYANTNKFKCFGCGAGGDGINFIQLLNGLPFTEAVENICKDHNIPFEFETNIDTKELEEKRKALDTSKKILGKVHEYYKKQLAENGDAKQYCYDRGLTDAIIEEYELGYAPATPRGLAIKLIEQGWEKISQEIGLITEHKGVNYDFYQNRIIIPIRDRMEQLVGFAGRAIGDTKPKYLNPKESFVYQKSKTWYGLDKQCLDMVNRERGVYICEGYFDVIQMQYAGVKNIVAGCGTNIHDDQIKVLKRYTNNINLMQDDDKAGVASMEKLLPNLLKQGFYVNVVNLEGKDPDEVVRELFKEN